MKIKQLSAIAGVILLLGGINNAAYATRAISFATQAQAGDVMVERAQALRAGLNEAIATIDNQVIAGNDVYGTNDITGNTGFTQTYASSDSELFNGISSDEQAVLEVEFNAGSTVPQHLKLGKLKCFPTHEVSPNPANSYKINISSQYCVTTIPPLQQVDGKVIGQPESEVMSQILGGQVYYLDEAAYETFDFEARYGLPPQTEIIVQQ